MPRADASTPFIPSQKYGGRRGEPSQKLAARRLQLLEVSFQAHADEEGKVELDAAPKVIDAALCRYLERELDMLVEEHESAEKPEVLDWQDIKSMVTKKQPFVTRSWQEASGGKMDPDDIFTQLFEAHKVLADGLEGGIDVHSLEYILGTCGETVSHDEFDAFMDKIMHPPSGEFQMQKMIMYLGRLMEEVGMEGSAELAKAAVIRCEDLTGVSTTKPPLHRAPTELATGRTSPPPQRSSRSASPEGRASMAPVSE
jgi:hypothetical protein